MPGAGGVIAVGAPGVRETWKDVTLLPPEHVAASLNTHVHAIVTVPLAELVSVRADTPDGGSSDIAEFEAVDLVLALA